MASEWVFGMALLSCVQFAAAFQRNPQTDAVVDAVMGAADHSSKGLASVIDVAEGQVARMKAGHEAGPGIARFAYAPASWWVAFIKRVAPLYGLVVIDNDKLVEYLERTNRLQVRMLEIEERRRA